MSRPAQDTSLGWNPNPFQKATAREMFDFVAAIPSSADLEWTKDLQFLYFFEAERITTIRDLLLAQGITPDTEFDVLDVGYLHGLISEFLHRIFPKARFTVIDHPQSPLFKNQEYQALIEKRNYLKLLPCDIRNAGELNRRFEVIILGEIIEHLDPTFAVSAINGMLPILDDTGVLVITSPNGSGIINLYDLLRGREVAHPVIPDKMMNWGHIHIWTPGQLEKTLNHYGWKMGRLIFNHGFERWQFHRMNQHWWGALLQIPMRICYHMSQAVPRWRGYFVAGFSKSPTTATQ